MNCTTEQASPPPSAEPKQSPEASPLDNKVNVETTAIGKYTLYFRSEGLEQQWRNCIARRQQGLIIRFFFVAGLFQILFFCSDIVQSADYILVTTPIRFISALVVMTASLLTKYEIIKPDTSAMFTVNLTYGACTLAIFYLQRKVITQWDSLFAVYGLSFFILPRLQPLDFFYGCLGSCLFSAGYLYISLYRLTFSEWLLSSAYLLIPIIMFNYISYSSEKSAKERWLLKQRLNREKIQVELEPVDDRGSSMVLSMNLAAGRTSFRTADGDVSRRKRKTLVKGFGLWVLLSMLGWFTSNNIPEVLRLVDSSVAWAVFTHAVGFSFFLILVTGQLRWIMVVAFFSSILLFVFSIATIPDSYILFAIHGIGYVLFAVMLMLMLGVFGGVVYIWSELIDFVKRICLQYPQIQESLKDSPLLEQVLVPQLSRPIDLDSLKHSVPATSTAGVKPHVKLGQSFKRRLHSKGDDHDSRARKQAAAEPIDAEKQIARPSMTLEPKHVVKVLEGRRPQTCFFCMKREIKYFLPACEGWTRREGRDPTKPTPLPTCTPYTALQQAREALMSSLEKAQQDVQCLTMEKERVCQRSLKLGSTVDELQQKLSCFESQRSKLEKDFQQKLRAIETQAQLDIDATISRLNATAHDLSEKEKELKRTRNLLKERNDKLTQLEATMQQMSAELHAKEEGAVQEALQQDVAAPVDEDVCPSCLTSRTVHLTEPHPPLGPDLRFEAPRRLKYAQMLELEGLKESAQGMNSS